MPNSFGLEMMGALVLLVSTTSLMWYLVYKVFMGSNSEV